MKVKILVFKLNNLRFSPFVIISFKNVLWLFTWLRFFMTFSYVFKRIWWKFKFSDFLKKSKLHRKTVSEVFQYCSYSGGHLFMIHMPKKKRWHAIRLKRICFFTAYQQFCEMFCMMHILLPEICLVLVMINTS